MHVTLDLLGEYVRDLDVAAAARDAYINLVHTIAERRAQQGLDANISIKLSMLGQKIDEGFCLDNLRQLLDHLQVARLRDDLLPLGVDPGVEHRVLAQRGDGEAGVGDLDQEPLDQA